MQNQTPTLKIEFVVIMALLMSLVALSIDGILPALAVIGNDLGVSDTKDHQLLITMIFLGLGFGQLIFGPLSFAIFLARGETKILPPVLFDLETSAVCSSI